MARPDHRTSRPLQPAALSLISLACLAALHAPAQAQTAEVTLPTVTIRSAGSTAPADVTGFGDQPAGSVPISTTVIDSRTISEVGARRISDLYKLDASVSDAYNAVGYYDYASVRGFVIDNTYNFRREGLPVSAETSLPLDHLQRVELLKGTSGIQAGTSAPGGLINLVVKRPTAQPERSFRTEVNEDGNALVHLDMSGRAAEGDLGWRLNVAGERLNTEARGTEGKRGLLALAMDARLSRDSLLEGEFEISRRRQATVPGLSLLGTALPPADPRININTQPWSQPTDFRNFSGSLRFTQAINSQWNWQAQLGTQRLKTDDFLAYPFGCSFATPTFCSDGSFDLYDYRSYDERRNTHSAQFKVNGRVETGGVQHDLSLGMLASRLTVRGNDRYGYNPVGSGNLFTLPTLPAATGPDDSFTNRTERSTEFFVTDVMRWSEAFQTWAGLRHTRLDRASTRTRPDDQGELRAASYKDSFTTPWLAASLKLDPRKTVYASWGQGVESEVAPGRSRYTNRGQALPALKSRQWEAGIRSQADGTRWNFTYFDITRPVSTDLGICDSNIPDSCTRVIDGSARHRGIELGGGRTAGAWDYDASLAWINAERQGSAIDPMVNGLRPTNVPRYALRANVGRRIDALPGLSAHAHLSHEGRRAVTPQNDVELGSWTRVDASLRYATKVQGQPASWVLGIDNLFDRRYFQEAPFQYGHIYLFPAASRTVRVAFESQF